MPRARDLTATEFTAAMARHGFSYRRGAQPRCRDRWLGAEIPADVAPVTHGRRVARHATLTACKVWRTQETLRRTAAAATEALQRAFAGRLAPGIASCVRAQLTGDAAIARMADDMIEITARGGACDSDDLALRGWLYPQINELAPRARTEAQARELRSAA